MTSVPTATNIEDDFVTQDEMEDNSPNNSFSSVQEGLNFHDSMLSVVKEEEDEDNDDDDDDDNDNIRSSAIQRAEEETSAVVTNAPPPPSSQSSLTPAASPSTAAAIAAARRQEREDRKMKAEAQARPTTFSKLSATAVAAGTATWKTVVGTTNASQAPVSGAKLKAGISDLPTKRVDSRVGSHSSTEDPSGESSASSWSSALSSSAISAASSRRRNDGDARTRRGKRDKIDGSGMKGGRTSSPTRHYSSVGKNEQHSGPELEMGDEPRLQDDAVSDSSRSSADSSMSKDSSIASPFRRRRRDRRSNRHGSNNVSNPGISSIRGDPDPKKGGSIFSRIRPPRRRPPQQSLVDVGETTAPAIADNPAALDSTVGSAVSFGRRQSDDRLEQEVDTFQDEDLSLNDNHHVSADNSGQRRDEDMEDPVVVPTSDLPTTNGEDGGDDMEAGDFAGDAAAVATRVPSNSAVVAAAVVVEPEDIIAVPPIGADTEEEEEKKKRRFRRRVRNGALGCLLLVGMVAIGVAVGVSVGGGGDNEVGGLGLVDRGLLTPTGAPTVSHLPTEAPQPTVSPRPSVQPSFSPAPSLVPSQLPSHVPLQSPSTMPSTLPSKSPVPTAVPSRRPSSAPSSAPTAQPSVAPSKSRQPSRLPSSLPSAVPSVSPSSVPSWIPTAVPTISNAPTVSFAPSQSPTADFCRLCANNLPTPFPDNPSAFGFTCGQVEENLVRSQTTVDTDDCRFTQAVGVANCGCPFFAEDSCIWCGRNPRTGIAILPRDLEACGLDYVTGASWSKSSNPACPPHLERFGPLCPCNETKEEAIERTIAEQWGQEVLDDSTARGKATQWVISDGRYNATQDEALLQLYALTVFFYVWEIDVLSSYRDASNECEWEGVECNNEDRVTSFKQAPLQGGTFLKEDAIPDEIAQLSELETLVILRQSAGLRTIPTSLGKLEKLRELALEKCELEGSIPLSLFDKLINLETLSFKSNDLSDVRLPRQIGNLVNLQTLDLENNFGTGGTIPSSIGNLLKLEKLLLSNNRYPARIPSAVQNLTSLKTLAMANTGIGGTLPSWLPALNETIEVIRLSDNELSGTLPPFLGNLRNLKRLEIQRNNLVGTIPSSLADLVDLTHLELLGNRLTGAVPTELCVLPNLKRCDVCNCPNRF